MPAVVFFATFFGLLASGLPIFIVLGLCAAILFALSSQNLVGVAQLIVDHLNSPTLMSLPLFVMAATFMRVGGVAQALVNLAIAWLGGLRGSLGLVTVVSCTLFAAICGSSVATALAMGTILVPAMIERGYPRSFALGVVGASGTIGIVVPPSLALILYGIVADQSVPRLFVAGILPGLLQAAAFIAWVMYDARRKNYPIEPAIPFAERIRLTVHALPALAVPTIVVVGIYGGVVTVTEAAALSGAAAMAVSLFYYKGFRPEQALAVVAEAVRSAAAIMLIVATALAFGHWVAESGIPERLINFTLSNGLSTWRFLLTINILLLVLGCFLEVMATLLLILPVLAPALAPDDHYLILWNTDFEASMPIRTGIFIRLSSHLSSYHKTHLGATA
jgi:C4-dicarboxylate transporter, DctM subunit